MTCEDDMRMRRLYKMQAKRRPQRLLTTEGGLKVVQILGSRRWNWIMAC
jgi:hypothetical protein